MAAKLFEILCKIYGEPSRKIDILFLGSYTRFSCSLRKLYSQRAKITNPPFHSLYPIPSPLLVLDKRTDQYGSFTLIEDNFSSVIIFTYIIIFNIHFYRAEFQFERAILQLCICWRQATSRRTDRHKL